MKDKKLTNFQVPRDPRMKKYDDMKNAPAIDMNKYQNMGGVEHHDSIQSVADKMIAKREAKTGIKVDQVESEFKLNLGGINDDRKDKKPL